MAIAVSLVALVGGTLISARHADQDTLTVARGNINETRPALCSAPRVRCETVRAASGTSIEFAVVGATATPKGLVLVEVGGPGLDVMQRSDTAALGLPGEFDAYDLLLIREPWTQAAPSPQCQEATREVGIGLASGRTDTRAFTSCRLESWTRASYGSALDAVLRKERRTLSGIVGQSFGALPALAAASATPGAWLVLNAPIAAHGTPGSRVLSDRIAVLERELRDSYAATCRRLKLDCAVDPVELTARSLTGFAPRLVPGRSLEIGPDDVALAVIAAAYDLGSNGVWLWPALTQLNSLADDDYLQLGRLSDQLTQRFDKGRYSLGLVAYVQGLCRSYGSWDGVGSGSPVAAFFVNLSRYCRTVPDRGDAWGAGDPAITGSACILVNLGDPVVLPEWADAWAQVLPGAASARYRRSGHVSLSSAVTAAAETKACVGKAMTH